MIPDANRSILVRYLTKELLAVAQTSRLQHREMAEAIVCFLEDQGVPEPIPSELMTLTAARCLHGIGLNEEAWEFIQIHSESEQNLRRCEAFLTVRPFTYRMWQLLDAGVIHIDRTTETTSLPHYVLDISLIPMESGDLELTFFIAMRKLLEEFKGLWNQHQGQFHLAIKGIPASRGRSKKLPGTDAILEYTRELFSNLAEEGGWEKQPDVTCRDLRARM